jgi:hypothetical protein
VRRLQQKAPVDNMKVLLVIGSAALALAGQACPLSDCTKSPLKDNKVCDTSLSPTQRAAALVSAMTLNEKIVNLVRQVHLEGFMQPAALT